MRVQRSIVALLTFDFGALGVGDSQRGRPTDVVDIGPMSEWVSLNHSGLTYACMQYGNRACSLNVIKRLHAVSPAGIANAWI